jgi:hypothetical protein
MLKMNDASPSPGADIPVVIGRYSDPFDAHLVVGALAAAGVQATLQQEYTAALHAPLSAAVGGVLVLVAPADLSRARVVLDAAQSEV